MMYSLFYLWFPCLYQAQIFAFSVAFFVKNYNFMMNKRKSIRLVKSEAWQGLLAVADAKFIVEMLEGWSNRHISKRNAEITIKSNISAVKDLVMHSGLPPWRWTEQIFEQWGAYLALNRRLVVSTQRKYQSAIRGFLDYLIGNAYFQSETQRRYGTGIRQIVTADNSLVHRVEDESERVRRAFSDSEITRLFEVIDQELAIMVRQNHKGRFPLMRDKAFFAFQYVTGTRIGEVVGVNLNSFLEHPSFPEFGQFARVSVWGKGSQGSGPKHRNIIVDHPGLPSILKWYKDRVRPEFARIADPNEMAFFLNERGRRVSIGGMEKRFERILELAGLDGQGFVTHSLRQTSITHGSMILGGSLAMKYKAGHKFQATTEGYADYPDDFVQKEVEKATRQLIDKQLGEDDGDD